MPRHPTAPHPPLNLHAPARARCSAGTDRHAHSKLFLHTLKGHTDVVNGLSFSVDGLSLATACDDRAVRVYALSELGGPKSIAFRSYALRKAPADVGFGPDAQQVAVLTRGEPGGMQGGCRLGVQGAPQRAAKDCITC